MSEKHVDIVRDVLHGVELSVPRVLESGVGRLLLAMTRREWRAPEVESADPHAAVLKVVDRPRAAGDELAGARPAQLLDLAVVVARDEELVRMRQSAEILAKTPERVVAASRAEGDVAGVAEHVSPWDGDVGKLIMSV